MPTSHAWRHDAGKSRQHGYPCVISRFDCCFQDTQQMLDVVGQEIVGLQPRLLAVDTIQAIAPYPFASDGYAHLMARFREITIPHEGSLMVASQANRRPESCPSFRPQVEDIRMSSEAIRQAETVLLLHCEDYFWKGDPDYKPSGMRDIFIHRQQKPGEQHLQIPLQ